MALTAPSSTLTGQTIASSYDQLLFLDDAAGVTEATLKIVSGTTGKTALSISDEHILIKGVDTNNAAGFEVQQTDGTSILKIAADTPAATLIGTLTVGADGTGHDVIFYGDSASSNMTWDQDGNTDGQLILNDARLFIDQDEDDNAIYIDSESTNNNAIQVYGKYGFHVTQDISGGRAAYFYRDLAEAGSLPLVRIVDDHTSNTQPALNIQQDGAGYGLEIDQNGDNNALYIESESTSSNAIQVYGKYGLYVNQDISDGRAAYLVRNLAEAGSSPLVTIIDNHTSNTQPALQIQQDGDAAHIEFSGVGTGGIKFKASATDSADANTLDDYEEGTWTGVVSDGTNPMTMHGSWTTGFYTKIGNLVTVNGQFITTSLGSASGSIRLTGLPFTSFNANSTHAGTTVGYGAGLDLAAAGQSVGFYIAPNVTHINLNVWDATTGTTAMQASEWTADGAVIFEFSYRAA